ncbi:acyl-CoA ligase (AMP-forming), exosortase A system-associated [Novosphingopyxis sp.]|uniref:acyl-CoA ligase (AMP-forming), exosortase A system-associated n=1 Tax=Novosphingopyxis sp. TaxID=2709690 RepID=UPI003B5CDCB4
MPHPLVLPLDHLALRGDPAAPALRLRGSVINHEALNLRIGRLAAWLLTRGLSEGDRAASWMGKTEIACLMPLAAARAGLIHVPINPLLKRAQVAHILSDSGARLLIAGTARLGTLEDGDLSEAKTIEEREADEALDGGGDALPASPGSRDTDDLAAILYTSGSTGRPKGVMLSHANLWLGALSVAEYLKLGADDVTLAVLPLSFDYGQNQLLGTWAAGGSVAPLDYLTAKDVIKACAKHQVTTLAAVPPLWVQLVEQAWMPEAVTPMRRLTNSGGALTPGLVIKLRGIFERADIYAMYGLTEAFRSTYLDPSLIDGNPTSMGRAIPHAEIMVVAEDGDEAAPDAPGELVHAGPLVAQGYWRDAARTAERFRPAPAWSRYGGTAVWSGDTVKRGHDGLLYFVGRDDAMIKTSGNRVSPQEIEEAADASDAVAESCAMGRKDESLGEAIVLFARGNGDEAGLRAHLKATLPNFMQPSEVVWLGEFPKNANGKIDRTALKARIAS